jgi:hypothetical protein
MTVMERRRREVFSHFDHVTSNELGSEIQKNCQELRTLFENEVSYAEGSVEKEKEGNTEVVSVEWGVVEK